jgi:F-type H+-transporting ATPase subunit epsilon
MPQLHCIVVTPERKAIDERFHFIALPLVDGEIGIAAGRAPMVGRLGFGELRLRKGDQVTSYYVDGGFVQVSGVLVSVMTSRAIPLNELDAEAAAAQLEEARRQPIDTPEREGVRDRAMAEARAQLRIIGLRR